MTQAGLFRPDSVAWRIDRERAVLLGGGRSLLMQLAHPLVARGVAEHSDFQRRPFRRITARGAETAHHLHHLRCQPDMGHDRNAAFAEILDGPRHARSACSRADEAFHTHRRADP